MGLRSIEGPSFAGKSTLAQSLTRRHDAVFVGEYMDYAHRNGRRGFPPPPATIAEAKMGVDFFINIERERTKEIRQHLGRGRAVISDRTVLSLAAYQFALDREKNALSGLHIAVPDYTIEAIRVGIKAGDIEMPEHLIVLRAASHAVHDARVQRRGNTTMGVFNHWHFSVALSESTDLAADLLLPKSAHVQKLVSYEGETAFAKNFHDASAFFEL